ncbi:hypothetical protein FRC02_010937 [Tulasnella sp. 418]|nr:hypothetical protein FRC02_010937 [Tulasnella sp. 418]
MLRISLLSLRPSSRSTGHPALRSILKPQTFRRQSLPSSTTRQFSSTSTRFTESSPKENIDEAPTPREHAVISTFDLFSIGVGPSSSHTVGPMRAAKIFIVDITDLGLLDKVHKLKITLYGSLAATGKGHMTPQALMMGFQGNDPETIDTGTIQGRYDAILENKTLLLGGARRIKFDMDKDMVWRFDQVLKTHPNGMRFSVFGKNGDLLATNEFFSVGGGFVVNEKTKVDENLYYMGVDKKTVDPSRRSQTHAAAPDEDITGYSPPPYLFHSAESLLALTDKHNLTIAQLVYDNERHYLSPEQIREKLMGIWGVMDNCIRTGVSTPESILPGRLGVRRRAPMLYKRLMRGFYPALNAGIMPALDGPKSALHMGDSGAHTSLAKTVQTPRPRPPKAVGSYDHDILPMPTRKTVFPGVDFLSCYAIAVNEVNAAGGRIVTSPTNGASGVIPAVLKYIVEFISEDPEADIATFLYVRLMFDKSPSRCGTLG